MNDTASRSSEFRNDRALWLSRLLAPRSIALVGASDKPDSFGRRVEELLTRHGYDGSLYLVNPKYTILGDTKCYADLGNLPEVPDLVVVAAGNHAIESILNRAIDLGAGGMVVFANNYLEGDSDPPLLERLKVLARNSGMPVCGGNGMGFYNYDSRCLVSFDAPPDRPPGSIALVAHSGSVMTYLANTDPRLSFNLVVSPGQEINGSVADYMLYALQQPSTRVLAIFIEAVRDPDRFLQALETARDKEIPVILVKVGSTEKSARMAASHSGALAGSDTAFQAICDRYGAIRVGDIDDLAATALAFSQGRIPGAGGLSSLLDSGGLREQMIDLAEPRGVTFAELGKESVDALEKILEYGLVAENPVDAMGALNADITDVYARCLEIVDSDENTAMISLEFEFRDGFSQYPQLFDVVRKFRKTTDKPFVLVNSTVNVMNALTAAQLGQQGIPVINGVSLALVAIGNLFRFRDYRNFTFSPVVEFDRETIHRWSQSITKHGSLGETQSLQFMAECGMPVIPFRSVSNSREAVQAATDLGFPVAMKTAQPDLHHKTDVGGVLLSLCDAGEVLAGYQELSLRLGEDVLVAPMVEDGIELAFGMVNDPQFGPVVMLSAGGILVELMDDRRFIVAPFGFEEAKFRLESMSVYTLLKGARGKSGCDIEAIATALSRFSQLCFELRDCVAEIDVNPVIATAEGCYFVDALVIAKDSSLECEGHSKA